MSDTPATNLNATTADLQLVFPDIAAARSDAAAATRDGKTCDVSDAVAAIASRLRSAASPTIAGLGGLTLESIDAAVRLAQRYNALLLPHPAPAPELARQRVSQHGSLDAACDAELIVWVGCNGETSAATRRIAERQLRAAFVKADLDVVLKLRATHAADPKAEPIGSFKRVAAVLAHDAEPRVVSQWHRLAADIQTTVRMSVLQLPDPAAPHRRAVEEVTTWLTGVSPAARGGVAFVGDRATPCPPLTSLLRAGSIDYVLWLGTAENVPAEMPPFDALATTAIKGATIAITLPPIGIGQQGTVMRFDGVTLNPAAGTTGRPDAMAGVLSQLLAHNKS